MKTSTAKIMTLQQTRGVQSVASNGTSLLCEGLMNACWLVGSVALSLLPRGASAMGGPVGSSPTSCEPPVVVERSNRRAEMSCNEVGSLNSTQLNCIRLSQATVGLRTRGTQASGRND